MDPNARSTWALAEFVASKPVDLGDPVRERAVMPVLDSIGVMLAGVTSEAGAAVLRYAGSTGTGPCWSPGRRNGASAEVAAMVNATLGHALDFDDALPGSGHLAVPTLAATLATADAGGHPLTGADLVSAFVVGFEVAAKLGKAFGVEHYRRGWHPTVTGGTFGATAAAATVLGFDPVRTARAFGIAGSLTAGVMKNFGTMTKPLHSGLAARNGVAAALLVDAGMSASEDVFDGPGGLFDLYGFGAARPDVLQNLGAPWSLIEPGTALKRYPCCYAAARPIDAVLDLRARHRIQPADVAQIVCLVPKTGLHAMIHRDPATGLNAKFSMEYVLAAALLDGKVDLESFTDSAVHRPDVRALMAKVTTGEEARLRPEDPEATRSSPATGGWVEVTIRTNDGAEHFATVRAPVGSPANPLSMPALVSKIRSCARSGGFDADLAQDIARQLAALESVTDVSAVLAAIHVGAAS